MTGQDSSDDPIFHIALPGDWVDAFASGEYSVSTRGMSLGDVGFIHCSTAEQIEATANRFYGDLTELVLLTIDPLLVPCDRSCGSHLHPASMSSSPTSTGHCPSER